MENIDRGATKDFNPGLGRLGPFVTAEWWSEGRFKAETRRQVSKGHWEILLPQQRRLRNRDFVESHLSANFREVIILPFGEEKRKVDSGKLFLSATAVEQHRRMSPCVPRGTQM